LFEVASLELSIHHYKFISLEGSLHLEVFGPFKGPPPPYKSGERSWFGTRWELAFVAGIFLGLVLFQFEPYFGLEVLLW